VTQGEQPVGSEEATGPTIRDRRRIDPLTGERREPGETPASGAAAGDDRSGQGPDHPPGDQPATTANAEELAEARAEAAERLDDLRRLQAEFVNYRRRVDRDREAVREVAKAEVLGELLGVLDDVGRARDHGDLTGGFRSVGESLEAVTAKLGLVRFGEVGDPFDPTIHEALMHGYSDEVSEPTCTEILQPGYRVGERILRAARVTVSEPTEALPAATGENAGIVDDVEAVDPPGAADSGEDSDRN
jgi:molecular chaperone GrpE